MAMARRRRAALWGRRIPCSQLLTDATLVPRYRAKSLWLRPKVVRTLRISFGFKTGLTEEKRATRRRAFSPRRYFIASPKPDIMSLKSLAFIFAPLSSPEPLALAVSSVALSGQLARFC